MPIPDTAVMTNSHVSSLPSTLVVVDGKSICLRSHQHHGKTTTTTTAHRKLLILDNSTETESTTMEEEEEKNHYYDRRYQAHRHNRSFSLSRRNRPSMRYDAVTPSAPSGVSSPPMKQVNNYLNERQHFDALSSSSTSKTTTTTCTTTATEVSNGDEALPDLVEESWMVDCVSSREQQQHQQQTKTTEAEEEDEEALVIWRQRYFDLEKSSLERELVLLLQLRKLETQKQDMERRNLEQVTRGNVERRDHVLLMSAKDAEIARLKNVVEESRCEQEGLRATLGDLIAQHDQLQKKSIQVTDQMGSLSVRLEFMMKQQKVVTTSLKDRDDQYQVALQRRHDALRDELEDLESLIYRDNLDKHRVDASLHEQMREMEAITAVIAAVRE